MSTSLSTYHHSSLARSFANSSSKAPSFCGANSNHVKKSNGSPSSRQWCSRLAIRGRYVRPIDVWRDRSSYIARRSSWARAHQPEDFLIGIKAARVASMRPRLGWMAASASASARVVYRELLTTPRKVQSDLVGISLPSTIVSRSAGSSVVPRMARTLVKAHCPLIPAWNETSVG